MSAAAKIRARIVENKTAATDLKMSDAFRWGIVMEVQDALEGLALMISLLADHDEPVPHHVMAIIRVISSRLDRPLGIEDVG